MKFEPLHYRHWLLNFDWQLVTILLSKLESTCHKYFVICGETVVEVLKCVSCSASYG